MSTLPSPSTLRRPVTREHPPWRSQKLASQSGPTPPVWALQRVGCYLRYSGRDASVFATAAQDPLRTISRIG